MFVLAMPSFTDYLSEDGVDIFSVLVPLTIVTCFTALSLNGIYNFVAYLSTLGRSSFNGKSCARYGCH